MQYRDDTPLDTTLTDMLPMGVCVIDAGLRVLLWNQCLANWTGITASEALGMNLLDRYPHLAQPRFRRRLEGVFREGCPAIFSGALHGHFIPVGVGLNNHDRMIQETAVRPVPGNPRQALVTIQDHTTQHHQLLELRAKMAERQRAEEELRRYAIQLQQSNRDLDQFATVASHDLQEPLRKIRVFASRLESEFADALPETARHYIDWMCNSANRMRDLIEDLLAYARTTSRNTTVIAVDLSDVVQEVMSDLQVSIEETGAEIHLDQLPTARMDRTHMRQLLQNLIGNALKYRRSGVPPVITVSARWSADACAHELSVSDNGIGFDTKYANKIFDVFQRLHGRDQYAGTGIGLSVCRKIVERWGGRIWATSTPGQGSAFMVTLPVEPNGQPGTEPMPQPAASQT